MALRENPDRLEANTLAGAYKLKFGNPAEAVPVSGLQV
jgi:hypothetical protein